MRRGGGEQRRHAGELLAALFPFKEIFLFLSLLLFLPGAAFGAGPPPPPPKPAKYVTDLAGVLPAERAARLNEKLAAFERDTSNQVLVYVDRKIPDSTTLEEFANRAFHAWGLGQKGKSNGIALFLFTDDRRIRMEVGYGLEGAVPDARAHRINAEIIAPRFRSGDVAGALEAGTDAIFAAARGEPYKGTGRTAAERRGPLGIPAGRSLGALIPLALFSGGFVFIFAIIVWAARRAGRGRGSAWGSSSLESGTSSSSDFSSSSSSSDSSSSSSDFSGGGGDSGGGGSSD
jgi:uncharacterized protein